MNHLKSLTNWANLEKMLNETEQIGLSDINESEFREYLLSRVRGQDPVIHDVVRMIRLQMAKKNNQKPLCNFLFLGPTGTGKTELAKSICHYLYGDDKHLLRFDCSEFSSSIAKDRLVGMPAGYVGAEGGGQLTRAVMNNPKRVILFDEIEKAHPSVFDLFLQLLGEARLTEQFNGQTVDFSQCVIIMTSNALAEKISKIPAQIQDPVEQLNAIKSELADAHVFRPEIIGRIDKVYIFDSLKGIVTAEIALMKIRNLASDFGVKIEFVEPQIIMRVLEENKKISRFGVRELERIIFDLFAPHFADAKDKKIKSLHITPDLVQKTTKKVS